MEITIREILPEDVPVLSVMAKQTFSDTFIGTCSEEDMLNFLHQHYDEAVLAKEISNDDDLYFFAEIHGRPVGYLRFMEDYRGLPLMKQWKALELKRIYVIKEMQGKGIAQALMDFFLNYANDHEYKAVWLGVWEHNLRAQKFYEKYGFINSGHTHDFPIGNTPQTDFWFWKFL